MNVCDQYFFYYGATIFQSVGIEDSFVTQIILGAINVSRSTSWSGGTTSMLTICPGLFLRALQFVCTVSPHRIESLHPRSPELNVVT